MNSPSLYGFFDAIERFGCEPEVRRVASQVLHEGLPISDGIQALLEQGPHILCFAVDDEGPRWWHYTPKELPKFNLNCSVFSYNSREKMDFSEIHPHDTLMTVM